MEERGGGEMVKGKEGKKQGGKLGHLTRRREKRGFHTFSSFSRILSFFFAQGKRRQGKNIQSRLEERDTFGGKGKGLGRISEAGKGTRSDHHSKPN